MKALRQRTVQEGIEKHRDIQPRNYFEDGVQQIRIIKSRDMVSKCITDNPAGVIELCAGTADICGPFSEDHRVRAFDCNQGALTVAKERFPKLYETGPIPDVPIACNVLILCECLEHLEDPAKLVREWGPFAEFLVISHPIDGDLICDASAGEHQWSLNADDFANWFAIAGHEIIEQERFVIGGVYEIALARGHRNV